MLSIPIIPHDSSKGVRQVAFTSVIYIEQSDFSEVIVIKIQMT